jgi:hypothetical protein
MTSMGKAALDDPAVRKYAKALVEHLERFRDVDPEPGLQQLGRQFVSLASGRFDGLSGRYLDLNVDLDLQLARARDDAAR